MSQAGKGHVPEENLDKYRRLASIARRYDGLGDSLYTVGEVEAANDCWDGSGRYWNKANDLRVDL